MDILFGYNIHTHLPPHYTRRDRLSDWVLRNSPLALVCMRECDDQSSVVIGMGSDSGLSCALVAGTLEFVQPWAWASRKAMRCRGFDEELPYQNECSGTPSNLQQQYTTIHQQNQAFDWERIMLGTPPGRRRQATEGPAHGRGASLATCAPHSQLTQEGTWPESAPGHRRRKV